jgi:hypothetical protein
VVDGVEHLGERVPAQPTTAAPELIVVTSGARSDATDQFVGAWRATPAVG